MEGEVKEIQMEIAAIKKDRLDQTRKQPKLYGNVRCHAYMIVYNLNISECLYTQLSHSIALAT